MVIIIYFVYKLLFVTVNGKIIKTDKGGIQRVAREAQLKASLSSLTSASAV